MTRRPKLRASQEHTDRRSRDRNSRSLPATTARRFTRAVLTISAATMAAQLLALGASPILTRLYSPADFGQFATLNALSAILAVALALRLELAIPLPETDHQAAPVVRAALMSTAAALVTLTAAAIAFQDPIAKAFGFSDARLVAVVGVLACSYTSFNVLNAVAVREQRFRVIARRQLVVAIGTIAGQIGAGLLGAGASGLVVGTVVAQLIGSASLWFGTDLPKTLVDRRGVLNAARRYRSFSLLMTPAAVLNAMASHGQILLLTMMFSTHVVGSFGLVARVVAVPTMFIGQAVAHVYLSELALIRRTGAGAPRSMFIQTSRSLLAIGMVVTIGLGLLAPWVFPIVFGAEWALAGGMAQAFAVAAGAQLVVSPLSLTLTVYEQARTQLLLDLGRCVILALAVSVAYDIGATPTETVWFMSGAIVVTAAVNWWLCWRVVRRVAPAQPRV